jgi:hypothetical protein
MVAAAQDKTRAIVKPKVYPEQINAALGVAAPETPAGAEKSKK